MKSKLFIIPLLSVTFLFSGCASNSPVNKTMPETTTEVTTEQITETTTETETTTNQITTEIETTTEDLESKKQAAIEKDKEIWAIINLSQTNTESIQEATRLLVSGEDTYEELYTVAKQVTSNQEVYSQNLHDLDSKDCADYVQTSKLYVTNTKSVANYIINAIDMNEPRYFQNAADSISKSTSYYAQVVNKRIKYLTNAGLNDEEIKNITSSKESND